MKKKLLSFAAICVIFAAVFTMTGCPTTEPDDPVKSNDATLTSVKFGAEVATLGTPNADVTKVVAGSVTILNSDVTVAATPTNGKAKLQYAKVESGEDFEIGDLWGDTDFTFATGDALVIEVTAENGTTKLYYRVGVTLANVALSSLKLGSGDNEKTVTLGNPGSSWETAEEATVLFAIFVNEQPSGGTAIAATAKDSTSTIKFAKVTGLGAPGAFAEATALTFGDGDYLYIEVTASDGGQAYYKVQVNFQLNGRIKYGSPQVGTNEVGFVKDPLWDATDLESYVIDRWFVQDGRTPPDVAQTTAVAKAMWDELGVYIYVVVTDPDVSSQEKTGSEAHETDSFELFINEALPSKSYGDGGSQYRVGANGGRSGEGNSPQALEALNKTSAKKTSTGYEIIMQAPWRLRSKYFGADTYKNGWKIGFELQINCAPVTGQRYATLVWNNTANTNYQNATNWGTAELYGAPAQLNFPALTPNITTQPQPAPGVAVGDTVNLSVVATKLDNGNLSYQWFNTATGNAADGIAVSGATSAAYSLTALEGTNYYFVRVTNTLGTTTAVTTSTVVPVIAGGDELPSNWIDKVTMVNTSVPLYGFNLPSGATFGDYDRIKFELNFDAASSDLTSRRMRAWGNYASSAYVPGTADQGNQMQNASPGGLLLNAAGTVTYTAGTWVSYTIELSNRDTLDAAATIKATTGVVLLAFGPVPPGGGSGTNIFYIKNITLENADGSKVVKALNPESPLLWGGNGAGAYVTQNGADKVTRVLGAFDPTK